LETLTVEALVNTVSLQLEQVVTRAESPSSSGKASMVDYEEDAKWRIRG
jgi:hypothetical protein